MSKLVEVRVRPVVRYVVTRYESGSTPDGGSYGGSEVVGEFPNEYNAGMVADSIVAADPCAMRID